MFGEHITKIILDTLGVLTLSSVVAIFVLSLCAIVWKNGPSLNRKFVSSVTIATAFSFLFLVASVSLQLMWERHVMGPSHYYHLTYRVLHRPTVRPVIWMAYPGTGWIDLPIVDDTLSIILYGTTLYFWVALLAVHFFRRVKWSELLGSKRET